MSILWEKIGEKRPIGSPCMFFHGRHILLRVINKKNSKQILSSLLKTTQMGQIGIRSVLDTSMRPSLRKAL